MRKILPVALLSLLLPVAASAQFALGAKIGLAVPAGDEVSGGALNDDIALALPVQVDLNAYLAPNLSLGVYGGYAFGKVGSTFQDACDFYGYDCSVHLWRVGVKGELAMGDVMAGGFVPYLGAFLGGEWLWASSSGGGYSIDQSRSGAEFGVEAGGDTRLSDGLVGGAFISLSFGEYTRATAKDNLGNSASGSITSTGTHMWITFGLRGRFETMPAR